jgi:hypothetical protein
MLISRMINKGTKQAMRVYNFPAGELITFIGNHKPCLFHPDFCTYINKQIDRVQAAIALRQLKRDLKYAISKGFEGGEI